MFKMGDIVKRKEELWEGVSAPALQGFDKFKVTASFVDQKYPTVCFEESGSYQWDAAYFELVKEEKVKNKFQRDDKVISIIDTPNVPEGFIGYIFNTETGPDWQYMVKGEVSGVVEYFNENELELLSVSSKPALYTKEEALADLEISNKPNLVDFTKNKEEYTGGSSSYYKVHVANPTTADQPYDAECNDLIEALGLTFAEGNLFKAVWRIAADRNGKKKKGNNSVYDAEKVVFFAERLLVQEKSKEGK